MKKLIVLLFTVLLSIPVIGQRDETILKNPTIRLTGLWAGSTGRIHQFNSNSHYAHGGYFLFEVNKDFLVGWDGFEVSAYNENAGDIDVSTSALLLGYTYNGYRVFHPVGYLSIGRAESKADELPTVRSFVGMATVGAEFNIFRWFRIGGEVGYRYIADRGNDWVNEAGLSSPYAGIKLKFGWSWGK